MRGVPLTAGVDKAFRALGLAIENALQALNQQAGKLMSQGQYDKAESLAMRGREIQTFISEVEALNKRWKGLAKGGVQTHRNKKGRTPLWNYYQPILRALDMLGGEAKTAKLMPEVERLMKTEFLAGDRDPLAAGRRERWQEMILRARKHLVKEGWLERTKGATWRITGDGRKAAKAGLGDVNAPKA